MGMQPKLLRQVELKAQRVSAMPPEFVDGYEQPPIIETFYVKGNIQPTYGASDYSLFGDRRVMEAYSGRIVSGYVLLSDKKLVTNDKIFYRDKEYIVRTAKDWTPYQLFSLHYRAFITEDGV
jgi:hypothetical protein